MVLKQLSFSEMYIITLILLTFMGGIINFYQFINYIRQRSLRFLSSRNPSLIILFCIIALLTAFITTPFDMYFHHLSHHLSSDLSFFYKFLTEFIHELSALSLLIIILCRCWLLFYDYKFAESQMDQIWKKVINSDQSNFWLLHRKTFGNVYFIFCCALIGITIALIGLCIVGNIALKQENIQIFHIFTMFGVGIPLFLFILYLTIYKIKLIDDTFLIHKEIKLLTICIGARIISFGIDLIINGTDKFLFFYTMESVTTFLTVFIQCSWVLNQLKKSAQNDMDSMFFVMTEETMNKIKNNNENNIKNIEKTDLLEMIDLFDNQRSCELFIRHCVEELSIESALFLIETAQFKATLNKYNVGIKSVCYRYIDVNRENLVQYIYQQRQENKNKNKKKEEEILKDTSTKPIPSMTSNTSNSMTPTISIESTICLKPSSDIKTYKITSIKQETIYKQFQDTILSKNWLPIAMPLILRSDNDKNDKNGKNDEKSKTKTKSKTKSKSKSKSRSNSKTKTKTKSKDRDKSVTKSRDKTFTKTDDILLTVTRSDKSDKSRLSENNYIAPISLAVITDYTNISGSGGSDDGNKEEEEYKYNNCSNNNKSLSPLSASSISSHSIRSVDINWIYQYSRHLYLKYIDIQSDLVINIDHLTRKNLWSVFSKEYGAEAFQTIQLLHHEYLTEISLTSIEEQLFIQTYLYHAFDAAFHSIWLLLKNDSFKRFQSTKNYQILCKKINAQKLQNERSKIEREYSLSLKGGNENIENI